MNVKEAIELLSPPSHLILKGSYSGKVYYNSDNNNLETRKKYEEYECPNQPIDVMMKCTKDISYPCIVIWFSDYEICKHQKKNGNLNFKK